MEEINLGFYDSIAAEKGDPTKLTGVRVSMPFIPRWLEDLDKAIAGKGTTAPSSQEDHAGPRELRLIYEAIDRTFCMQQGAAPADHVLCCYLDGEANTLDKPIGLVFYCDAGSQVLDSYCSFWEYENLWVSLARLSRPSVGRFMQTYEATFRTFEHIAYIDSDDLEGMPGDTEEDTQYDSNS